MFIVRGNEAFEKFILDLHVLLEENLSSLFSRDKCESTQVDGTKRLGAVIMDSTAVRILGTLPDFELVTSYFSRVA